MRRVVINLIRCQPCQALVRAFLIKEVLKFSLFILFDKMLCYSGLRIWLPSFAIFSAVKNGSSLWSKIPFWICTYSSVSRNSTIFAKASIFIHLLLPRSWLLISWIYKSAIKFLFNPNLNSSIFYLSTFFVGPSYSVIWCDEGFSSLLPGTSSIIIKRIFLVFSDRI